MPESNDRFIVRPHKEFDGFNDGDQILWNGPDKKSYRRDGVIYLFKDREAAGSQSSLTASTPR